jgi:8-oxo-dGTP diphosphatase
MEVVAGILWRGGRYLAVERPEGKRHAGFLEFPGGKVEPGEGLEQALARELEEELGIRPLALRFRLCKEHDYPDFSVRLHFFDVTAFEGDPRGLENQALLWVRPGEAPVDRFLPADRDMVPLLECPPESPGS